MSEDSVLLDIADDGIAALTLNRPAVYNAFDDAMIAALHERCDELAGRDGLRAVILRGKGKHFCAGADASWMKRTADYSREENLADARALGAMLHALDTLPMPVIGLVQGAAMGGGSGLAACCDIVIANREARFALSEVRLGIIPATIGPYMLKAIGPRAARRYFLSGERFDAATAQRLGLVHEIADDLEGAAQEILGALLKSAPGAVRSAKALIAELTGRPIDETLIARTAEMIAERRATGEGKEGMAAFLEKRKPGWVEETE